MLQGTNYKEGQFLAGPEHGDERTSSGELTLAASSSTTPTAALFICFEIGRSGEI